MPKAEETANLSFVPITKIIFAAKLHTSVSSAWFFRLFFAGFGRWKWKAPRGNSLPRGALLLLRFCFAFLLRSAAALIVVNVFYFLWHKYVLVIAGLTFEDMICSMLTFFTKTISICPTNCTMLWTLFAIFLFAKDYFPTNTLYARHVDGLCLFVRFPAMARHRDGEFLRAAFVLDRDCRLAILFWY